MNTRAKGWIGVAVLAAFFCGPTSAADELSKDLTSTIHLLGLPCGQVVSSKRLGDNDYFVVCRDKNRYRVFVNAQGRVVAQKQ